MHTHTHMMWSGLEVRKREGWSRCRRKSVSTTATSFADRLAAKLGEEGNRHPGSRLPEAKGLYVSPSLIALCRIPWMDLDVQHCAAYHWTSGGPTY